jgi:hypothetical protein
MPGLFVLFALVQGGPWTVTPAAPTVGDTVWVERALAAPSGWRVRATRLPQSDDYEPLADPLVTRRESGWLVRYAIVAWTPGTVRVAVPPLWRLGPGGESDSTDAAAVAVEVRSVIPDSLSSPAPKPALAPDWPALRRPLLPAAAVLLSGLVLGAAIAWRRRGPKRVAAPPPAAVPAAIGDERWLAAGEPRAVAARAAAELRGVLARVVPTAGVALSTFEALAASADDLHQAEHKELVAVLTALDQVGFAAVHGTEVRGLVGRARRLARQLVP